MMNIAENMKRPRRLFLLGMILAVSVLASGCLSLTYSVSVLNSSEMMIDATVIAPTTILEEGVISNSSNTASYLKARLESTAEEFAENIPRSSLASRQEILLEYLENTNYSASFESLPDDFFQATLTAHTSVATPDEAIGIYADIFTYTVFPEFQGVLQYGALILPEEISTGWEARLDFSNEAVRELVMTNLERVVSAIESPEVQAALGETGVDTNNSAPTFFLSVSLPGEVVEENTNADEISEANGVSTARWQVFPIADHFPEDGFFFETSAGFIDDGVKTSLSDALSPVEDRDGPSGIPTWLFVVGLAILPILIIAGLLGMRRDY